MNIGQIPHAFNRRALLASLLVAPAAMVATGGERALSAPKSSLAGISQDRAKRLFAMTRWQQPRTKVQQARALAMLNGRDLEAMQEFYRHMDAKHGAAEEIGHTTA